MAGSSERGWRWRPWRIAPWAVAALLLLLPLVAMQFTEEVKWDEADFAIVAAMLAVACGAYELTARMTGSSVYRAAVGVAVATALILVWMNLAVGIIGSEDNPANLMYGGVLAVGLIGAIIARLRPDGMAGALAATALAQVVVAGIAAIAGMGYPASPPLEIVGVNALFAALWLTSAWLFRRAAHEEAPTGAAPHP